MDLREQHWQFPWTDGNQGYLVKGEQKVEQFWNVKGSKLDKIDQKQTKNSLLWFWEGNLLFLLPLFA